MSKFLLSLGCILLCVNSLSAQQKPTSPPKTFDFWIGTWEVTMSVAPKWEEYKAIDSVSYLLKNTLIQEIFTQVGGKGENFQRGYLNFIKRDSLWKHSIYDQTWGDFTFYGAQEGDKVILRSDSTESRQGMRRETFYDITENSFEYLWEASYDQGKNWYPEWKVSYRRKE